MSIGTATTFTLGTSISPTSQSWNSIALEIRSDSLSSIEPSSLASSTIFKSSSSVMPSLAWSLNTLRISVFSPEKTAQRGKRTTIKKRRSGYANSANASGISFAQVLGVISPKTSMTSVKTTVDIVGPAPLPKSSTNNRVASVEAVILTMLLPISSVKSTLS